MSNPIKRGVMGASYIHRRVEAFYAPQAGAGNQILPINLFTSVETIGGHTTMISSHSLTAPALCLHGHRTCAINTYQGRLGPQVPDAIRHRVYRHVRCGACSQ
jgi:hypothetical protein